MASPVPFGLNRLSLQTRDRILVVLVLILATAMRFYHLGSLPAALNPAEASYGIDALTLLHGHGFGAPEPLSQLYVAILAASVAIFGHTTAALRAVGATGGVAAVGLLFLLTNKWLGRRVALISSVLLAASPWAVTLSRNVTPWTLVPAGSLLVLWLALWAARSAKTTVAIAAALALGLSLYIHPVFWLLLVAVGLALVSNRQVLTPSKTYWSVATAIVVAAIIPAIVMAIRHFGTLQTLFSHTIWSHHLVATLSRLWHNGLSLVLMFIWHGDDSWLNNLSGQPMLNAFVGIMFLLGLIVTVTQIRRRSHRALLAWWIIGLVVPLLTLGGAPNARQSALALAPTMILATIGICYMLDRWYATFPINAAARSTGWAAMALLLALSSYQGYVQFFTAWGNSSEVRNSYDEAASSMASFASSNKFSGQRILTVSPDDLTVLSYLDYPFIPSGNSLFVPAGSIGTFHTTATSHQFIIDTDQRDAAIVALRGRFGGGKLYPHYSSFNNAELFYVYEVGK